MTLASIGALAAGMAFAQAPAAPAAPAQPAKPGVARRLNLRRRMTKRLNLTDAQKQQAKTIFQQAKQSAQPVRDQLKQDRQALTAAVENNDTVKIGQLSTTIGSLQGQLVSIRSSAMAKFFATLTPDQKAKAEQMRQSIRQRMEQRRAQRSNG